MSLYSEWQDIANAERTQKEHDAFWKEYFARETEVYKVILGDPETIVSGKFSELAERFDMDAQTFAGFMDGINTSLKKEYDIEKLKATSKIELAVDFEKLYFNMLDCKAQWLYTLPQWDAILTEEKRREITHNFRSSKMFISEQTVGRNDPCPCGSGKKYKKCCGRDK